MNLFIDKNKRRKSPFLLSVFGLTLLDILIFLFIYSVLTEPLYYSLQLASSKATNIVHAVIMALCGILICCLFFLCPDKRLVPCSFCGMAIVLLILYFSCFTRLGTDRLPIISFLSLFGLAPVILGNLITWIVYFRFKKNGYQKPKLKNIVEELQQEVHVASHVPAGTDENYILPEIEASMFYDA